MVFPFMVVVVVVLCINTHGPLAVENPAKKHTPEWEISNDVGEYTKSPPAGGDKTCSSAGDDAPPPRL